MQNKWSGSWYLLLLSVRLPNDSPSTLAPELANALYGSTADAYLATARQFGGYGLTGESCLPCPWTSTIVFQPLPGMGPQEFAGRCCLNSAACSFTKSRMFAGASPVSLRMVSVMRS